MQPKDGSIDRFRSSCPFCDKEMDIRIAHRSREIKKGLVEHGLYCSSCKKLVHSYYDTVQLSKQRKKIHDLTGLIKKSPTTGNLYKRRDAIAAYKRQFEKVQQRTLKKFNLPTDGTVIVWDYGEEHENG